MGRGRSHLLNAIDVSLAADLGAIETSVPMNDTSDLPTPPFYAVIEPFEDAGREYLWVTEVHPNHVVAERNLRGTQRRVHGNGTRVRITYMAQHLDDLWDGIAEVHNLGQGPMGVPGPAGSTGADSVIPGPVGPTGIRGDKLFLGIGAPTVMGTAGAQPGDEYVDLTTGDFYSLT